MIKEVKVVPAGSLFMVRALKFDTIRQEWLWTTKGVFDSESKATRAAQKFEITN